MSLTVTHEPDADRYAVYDGDELQGFIIYERAGTTLRLLHAEVPPVKRGQGVGGEVVRVVLDELRAQSTDRVQPVCGFVVSWMRRHPEYAELTTR
ncbi:MAG: N-acetyltransferase [Microcella sp.]|uniref:GNAT family N-acetyltransferase n=1 Tax=Microcella sp. TaxID=1913979 RepID=UPI0024C9CFF9|nr:N-acetyltransferase [Microcella sp.]UYN83202.1 MAG: N-acetyltransferase [Microcella sp.]